MIHTYMTERHNKKEEVITEILARSRGQKPSFGTPFMELSYIIIVSCQFVLLQKELERNTYSTAMICKELSSNKSRYNTVERCSKGFALPNTLLLDIIKSLEYLEFYPRIPPCDYVIHILTDCAPICSKIGTEILSFYGQWLSARRVTSDLRILEIPCIHTLFSFLHETFLPQFRRGQDYKGLSKAVSIYYNFGIWDKFRIYWHERR